MLWASGKASKKFCSVIRLFPNHGPFHPFYFTFSVFRRKNTLLIPLMSLRLIRFRDRPIRLDRRSLAVLDAVLEAGEMVTGLEFEFVVEFGLRLINDDARRLGVCMFDVTVVVVVVVGPSTMLVVVGPPLTARALPSMFSTQASLLGADVAAYVAARRGFVFGPAPPRGVYFVVVLVRGVTIVVVVTPGACVVAVILLFVSPGVWDGLLGTGDTASRSVDVPSPDFVSLGDLEPKDVGIGGTGGGVHAPPSFEALLPGSGDRTRVSTGRFVASVVSVALFMSKAALLGGGVLNFRDPCIAVGPAPPGAAFESFCPAIGKLATSRLPSTVARLP